MAKKPAAPNTGATSEQNLDKHNSIPTKHELCIYELLKVGTHGINQLKALSTYHDTCLNTTISELGLKRGLIIQREQRKHLHSAGGTTRFCWYWFPTRKEAQEGLTVLNRLREQRNFPLVEMTESNSLLEQFPQTQPEPAT
ncbi:hypothetical protein ACMXYO_15420 [Neptuniibacter sp. QD37_6]|uniref:hypothetical protein n=1 Tax=Neptuniibacter sp. QD37_6 TaxID=3398210 RepID=UPI0039F60780